MEELLQKRKVYKVSEITGQIRNLLEDKFTSVWIEGEISGYKLHSSGHIYLSLKDEQAILKCAFFKNANQDMKFKLQDGLSVLCFGRISVYAPRGDYQLYIEKIEPKGLGALQLAFQQLKEKLAKEGLFDMQRKRPLPLLPSKIGIVTSPTGMAIRDILKILKTRFANVEVVINPVRVQGEGAAKEIAQAIEDFNEYGNVDVLIVGRGGGSLEDLWAFNEEIVARAIFKSKIPVISAVGHEGDFTIADFVADRRAATPSNAAEIVVSEKKHLLETIETMDSRLRAILENKVEFLSHKLSSLASSYIMRRPLAMVEELQQNVDDIVKDMCLRIGHLLKLEKEKLNTISEKLSALSPLAILERGYSISLLLPKKTVIKDASKVKEGDRVETLVKKGSFISKVE